MADSEPTKGTTPNASPASDDVYASTPAFQPRTLFFYGSLMDPDVLSRVARLWRKPKLEDAWVEGFDLKLWGGAYPVVLPAAGTTTSTTTSTTSTTTTTTTTTTTSTSTSTADGKAENADAAPPRVRGKAWLAESQDQLDWLQHYETEAYAPVGCEVHVVGKGGEEDEEVRKGWVFAWSGERPAEELVEGTWDLREWQRTQKRRAFGW